MNGHAVLLLIAIVCELGATGVGIFYPEGNKFNMMALVHRAPRSILLSWAPIVGFGLSVRKHVSLVYVEGSLAP